MTEQLRGRDVHDDAAAALDSLSASLSSSGLDLSRRRFLQLVAGGAVAGLSGSALVEAASGWLPGIESSIAGAAPLALTDGVLVIVGMYGGNDGLNTLVHPNDGNYRSQRGALAVRGSDVLPLDGETGLHPQLGTLKRFWDAGQLAAIEGVGYPDPDFSHFTSMAIWMSAIRSGLRPDGWVGRWLDARYGAEPGRFDAVTIGSSLPLHMIGARQQAATVGYTGFNFGGSLDAWNLRMYGAVEGMSRPAGRGALHDMYTATLSDQVTLGQRTQPFMPEEQATTEIGAKLEVAARLINADLGFRVLDVGWRNFDQHANQPTDHPSLLGQLDDGLRRFFGALGPGWADRVTVMTFSEFGRTPYANGSAGTDHGSSNCAFVLGGNVKGGRYGQHPSLAGLGRWDRPGHTVDFRSYYASVIDGWLGGGSAESLGRRYEDLGLFRAAPGVGDRVTPVIGRAPARPPLGRFVPLTAARILDTRDGTGGLSNRPIGAEETVRVPVAGRGGVPVGATAAVLNVTSIGATQPTYLTLTPAGVVRPETSTLNMVPGGASANATVMALGADGAIDVYNRYGAAEVILDVFGYLSPTVGDQVTTVDPSRLLDTRDGTGGSTGPVDRNRRVDVQVAGRGGVPPSGASAVVLNVTSTENVSPGYVVAGASGAPMPATSNLNFLAPGMIVPNLVFCSVGADGKISLQAVCDGTHLVADVFGWIGADAGDGTIRAITPQRLLDTRVGLGAPQRQVGAIHVVRLQVANRAGVPSDATAALLNVTATNATKHLYVTVWPSGTGQPGTSNLNVPPGSSVANLVLCKLGPSGQLDFSSPLSHVDLIADVVGYVAP